MEEVLGFFPPFFCPFFEDRWEVLEDRADVVVDWLPYVALVLEVSGWYEFL